MIVTKRSPWTGKDNTLDLPITNGQWERWQGGELIQNVMPHLSDDEREFLISGSYPGEWEQYMGEEE